MAMRRCSYALVVGASGISIPLSGDSLRAGPACVGAGVCGAR